VLIVEDDCDVAEMMEILLSLEGYETRTAHNGAEALVSLRQRRPSVVLLDLQMPVMDGFEFRRRQLADPELASIPVLCLTAYHDPSRVIAALGVPCFGKPIDVPSVTRALNATCGNER
jgi:CheY-like chemotaxis protein